MLLDLVNTVGQRIGWSLEIGSRWGFRRSRCRWCRTELRRRRGQTCGPWRCRRNCRRRLTGKFRPLQCLGRVRLQWHKGIFVFVFLNCKRRCETVKDLRWGFKKLLGLIVTCILFNKKNFRTTFWNCNSIFLNRKFSLKCKCNHPHHSAQSQKL